MRLSALQGPGNLAGRPCPGGPRGRRSPAIPKGESMKNRVIALLTALVVTMGLATPASAQNAVDYSSLTGAVNFGSVITGLLAVGAIIVAVLVARKGIRWIMGMVK